MRPTMKDVAKHAAVSTATVSNVIRNTKYVSDPVKKRILVSMKELGYEPNIIARSLKMNKTYKIGVVVPDITNPFFSEIVKEVEVFLEKEGYQLILCNSHYQVERENLICSSFISGGGVDALILVAPRLSSERLLIIIKGMPAVIVDRPSFSDDENLVFIFSDNYSGASLVADKLVSKNYEKFACIAGPEMVPNANARLQGFVDRLVDKKIERDSIIVSRAEFTFDKGFSEMEMILEKTNCEERLGVFVCSDIAAWGALEAVKSRGLRIPEDVGIIGYDDISFAKYLHPGLTTIKNPMIEMGKLSATFVLDLLRGDAHISCNSVVLGSSLVERGTV